MRVVLGGLAAIVVLLALGFGLQYAGFETWAFFAPKTAAVQSNVFHASQQYQDTQSLNLAQYRTAFALCANDACRAAIKSTVQEQYANYQGNLTPDLQSFLDRMRD